MTLNSEHNGVLEAGELADALQTAEIHAHFQPKVDIRSARVVGTEALVRWEHPRRGLLAPADFLHLAQPNGHMRALTERVIEFSVRTAGDWWHSGLGLQVSLNLPPTLLSDPEWPIDEFVAEALREADLPGEALEFEITEEWLVGGAEAGGDLLRRLKALGSRISVDDFGSGEFSLRRLASLPLDELKLDRALVAELDGDRGRAVARSAIHVAHQLGMRVLAEGVETVDTWRQVRSMGCERAQGYLIAKPLTAREVPAWLATWNHRARELSSTRRVDRKIATKRRPAAAEAPAA